MPTTPFQPVIAEWFAGRFGEPTQAQRLAWPRILAGGHTLLAAPTGSGKTLAAFLVCIDGLLRRAIEGTLPDETHVVYVSPLKALSNDIRRNLETPLEEIRAAALAAGYTPQLIRAALRTGDTPPSQRQAMVRKPPHILVTTPESLYLLLTGSKSRETLRSVRTVIVDEIHALARDKRGSHLALTLARLDRLCERSPAGGSDEMPARGRPMRIGLSATQRPIEEIARFLVGAPSQVQHPLLQGSLARDPLVRDSHLAPTAAGIPSGDARERIPAESGARIPTNVGTRTSDDARASNGQTSEIDCHIIDTGHVRELDLGIEVPASELSAVCSMEQWQEVYARLRELITTHRSTLIFVNTRRMAERVCHHLEQELGEGHVASHHGSLSREIRLRAEERLKAGELKAIVATASLELGIDIGFIDLVCQIGSPRSIATFLQRVGRSGHALGLVPKGRLFALTRDELLEALALLRAVRQRRLDRVEIPAAPLDILAQQIVAAVACEDFDEDDLFALCRRAWPYLNLKRGDFDALVELLSEGIAPGNRTGAFLHRDRIHHRLRARRSARLTAITSGGAIPEMADYRVVTEGDRAFVGTINEDFAIESMSGDVFLLGNTSWRIRYVRGGEVTVVDARGAPATIPFWLGEAPGRTAELSAEVSALREELWRQSQESPAHAMAWLAAECGVGYGAGKSPVPGRAERPLQPPDTQPAWEWVAGQAIEYVCAQGAAIGVIPTQRRVVFERFFDESGGMQLVIHAPFGSRINRAWGLAMRKCFCRTFDFELQASADDNGIVLSVGPNHSFPLERMFELLNPRIAEPILVQALLAVPMFLIRWRWNVTRALAVLRQRGGKKVPPPLQRFRADDLLTAVFPMQTACFEHRTGDLEVPDHPLVHQTVYDCLHEAMDLDGWMEVLAAIEAGQIELVARDTREPSPFSYQLLNANPYAFLDDAPLEERRARAVAMRRTVRSEDVRELRRLDPEAIAQVRRDAWPVVRDAEELHDALLTLSALPAAEGAAWSGFFEALVAQGRATVVRCAMLDVRCGSSNSTSHTSHLTSYITLWVAAERWPLVRAAYPGAHAQPPLALPASLSQEVPREQAEIALIRGRLDTGGPLRTEQIAADLGLDLDAVRSALERLESEGFVLRGQFTDSSGEFEWCERRLLARIHRLTLDGLRRQVQPVEPEVFLRFLLAHHEVRSHEEDNASTQPALWDASAGRPAAHWGSDADGAALRRVITRLQGFEMPVGAWEREVLATRLAAGYRPEALSALFHTGELIWGRLQPPRSSEDAVSGHMLTRVVPISLMRRADLPWLLPPDRCEPLSSARGDARDVHEVLARHGALFFDDLLAASGLLPTQLEEALGQLAALGLVTADGFNAIRTLLARRRRSGRRPSHPRRQSPATHPHGGRWSRFPPFARPLDADQRIERWAWQLLHRYGVIFRDLLTRESAAPAWHELVPVYRRLEARGEIRGGRFVAGVAGEQFALPDVVERLRAMRNDESGAWHVLSAADPLNLVGIVTPGARIPATRGNRVLFVDGVPAAAREAGQTRWLRELPTDAQRRAEYLLGAGRSIRRLWLPSEAR